MTTVQPRMLLHGGIRGCVVEGPMGPEILSPAGRRIERYHATNRSFPILHSQLVFSRSRLLRQPGLFKRV